VGAGVSVSVLFSNVVAGVDDGATLAADGDITVRATSGSVEIPEGTDEDEQDRNGLLDSLGIQEDDFTARSIRAVSLTGSGAFVGVSVACAVIILENNTIAYLAGDITKADAVLVESQSNYPITLAVTATISGGVVGVGASFAVVATNGKNEGAILGASEISGVKTITVHTYSVTDATAVAAAFAGGAVGSTPRSRWPSTNGHRHVHRPGGQNFRLRPDRNRRHDRQRHHREGVSAEHRGRRRGGGPVRGHHDRRSLGLHLHRRDARQRTGERLPGLNQTRARPFAARSTRRTRSSRLRTTS
jgi:hypothetical protein